MSEPIMVVSATEKANATGPSETSSSGPGPPRRIALTLQRKVEPINAEEITDVPIIFVLGLLLFTLIIMRISGIRFRFAF